MDITIDQARKGLVSFLLEKSLLEIGKPVLEKVTRQLYKKYQVYLPDCYEQPEYLRSVLKEIFGNSYVAITSKIEEELSEFTYQKPIEQFLTVIVA
jgi:hypothetical protein